MLRASSLGLRCSRRTSPSGTLGCITRLAGAIHEYRRPAMKTKPSAHNDSPGRALRDPPPSAGEQPKLAALAKNAGKEAGGNQPVLLPPPPVPKQGEWRPRRLGVVDQARERLTTLRGESGKSGGAVATPKVGSGVVKRARIRFGGKPSKEKGAPPSKAARPKRKARPRATTQPSSRRKTSRKGEREKSAAKLEHDEKRRQLFDVLATTKSVSDAWDAYQTLMSLPHTGTRLRIPWEHLHRMTRLIAGTYPRTRTLFIRLFSVISTIHRTGGTVRLWQWNALIDFAGKGWRKTTLQAFRTSLDVYNDLISQKSPGAAFSSGESAEEDPDGDHRRPTTEALMPDIITFTTLINIAGRTLHDPTLRRATSLLAAHGLKPNRITYLSFLRYYTRMERIRGVRMVLATMAAEGMELGLDGTNAALWAFGRNKRMDISMSIYKVLRANIDPQPEPDPEIEQLRAELEAQHIRVPRDVAPDATTYVSLMQCFAYYGDFDRCLAVFMDFASALPIADDPAENAGYMSAYRTIFLGFSRHGSVPLDTAAEHGLHRPALFRADEPASRWTFDALQVLFDDFLGIPHNEQPTPRVMYWILHAFSRTTGGNREIMRAVQVRLEERFGGRWLGTGRLAKLRRTLFSEPGSDEPARVDGGDVRGEGGMRR